MMPSIPPDVPLDAVPEFLCIACKGADPVELELLETTPCRHCGVMITVDDVLEHAQEVTNALVRLGYGDLLVKTILEAGGAMEAGPEDSTTEKALREVRKLY